MEDRRPPDRLPGRLIVHAFTLGLSFSLFAIQLAAILALSPVLNRSTDRLSFYRRHHGR